MEAWRRVVHGEPLKGLPLTKKNGRIDLSALELPEPEVLERWQTPLAEVRRVEPNASLYSLELRDLDLTGGKLSSIYFSDCEITNCFFDDCYLHDLRLRATTITDCSFRGANLRGTALGEAARDGPFKGRQNHFTRVDFSEADLRETVYNAAAFQSCVFRNTKLSKIDFRSSSFVDCGFEGELREVRFWSSDPYYQDLFPRNQMLNVDFSRAKLRDVEFRGLTLAQVRLPDDTEHIVINDFANVLDELIRSFDRQGDQTARALVAYLGAYRRGTVRGARGILNKLDIAEGGVDALARVETLLREFSAEAQASPSAFIRTWRRILSR
jgi:uncharacterized protein YjbI with pentapeptide repeats